MEQQEAPTRWGGGVRISPPKLYRLEFEYDGAELPDGLEIGTEFTIGFHRFSRLEMGVEFGVSLQNIPELTAVAVYRMIFELDASSPEAQDPERAFRLIAARMAPVAIYPFMREAITSAAQKAFVADLTLPVQNVGALFDPETIEIPSPPEEQKSETEVVV